MSPASYRAAPPRVGRHHPTSPERRGGRGYRTLPTSPRGRRGSPGLLCRLIGVDGCLQVLQRLALTGEVAVALRGLQRLERRLDVRHRLVDPGGTGPATVRRGGRRGRGRRRLLGRRGLPAACGGLTRAGTEDLVQRIL